MGHPDRPAFVPPSQVNAPQGPVVQATPDDATARTSAPIFPPMAPPQPNWKDKDKPEDKPDTNQPDVKQGGEGGKE